MGKAITTTIVDGVESKACNKCSRFLPVDSFVKNKRSSNGYHWQCRHCDKAFKRKNTYGLSNTRFLEMLEEQGECCDLCGIHQDIIFKETKRSLCVDHCHETGEVRALLCIRCNAALGMFKDNENLLLKAAHYLSRHNKENHHR